MTDTDIIGKIITADGALHQIFQTVTDGTPEALTIYDLAGTDKNIYEYLLGKTIKRIEIQASDGSILDYVQVTQNGAETHYVECGERGAQAFERANLEIDVHIPVTETTRINVDTAD